MRRVLHIIPTLGQGGAERLLCDIVGRDDCNHHFVIKLFSGDGLFDDDVAKSSQAVYGLGLPRRLPLTFLILPFALARLLWLMLVLRPNIVIGWLYYGAIAASVAGFFRLPIIWSLHSADFDLKESFKPSTRAAVRLCRALAHLVPMRIQYCSDESRDHHERLGMPPTRSLVIANGVDLQRFSMVAVQETPSLAGISFPLFRGKMIIGCIARFEPQKDHRTLLEALARLKAAGRQLTLVLAGRGCDRANPQLQAMVEEFDLQDDVISIGIVAEVERLIRVCDCVVLSSCDGEAMPIAVLEALALGKPVVATNVGSTAKIVGNFGVVVPARRAYDLATAIERVLWTDASYRKAAAELAPAWIRDRYSLDKTVRHWNSVIAEIA